MAKIATISALALAAGLAGCSHLTVKSAAPETAETHPSCNGDAQKADLLEYELCSVRSRAEFYEKALDVLEDSDDVLAGLAVFSALTGAVTAAFGDDPDTVAGAAGVTALATGSRSNLSLTQRVVILDDGVRALNCVHSRGQLFLHAADTPVSSAVSSYLGVTSNVSVAGTAGPDAYYAALIRQLAAALPAGGGGGAGGAGGAPLTNAQVTSVIDSVRQNMDAVEQAAMLGPIVASSNLEQALTQIYLHLLVNLEKVQTAGAGAHQVSDEDVQAIVTRAESMRDVLASALKAFRSSTALVRDAHEAIDINVTNRLRENAPDISSLIATINDFSVEPAPQDPAPGDSDAPALAGGSSTDRDDAARALQQLIQLAIILAPSQYVNAAQDMQNKCVAYAANVSTGT